MPFREESGLERSQTTTPSEAEAGPSRSGFLASSRSADDIELELAERHISRLENRQGGPEEEDWSWPARDSDEEDEDAVGGVDLEQGEEGESDNPTAPLYPPASSLRSEQTSHANRATYPKRARRKTRRGGGDTGGPDRDSCLSPRRLLARPLSVFDACLVSRRSSRTRSLHLPIRPWALLLCLCAVGLATILLLASVVFRPAGLAAARRFCLPFRLQRISSSAHDRWSCYVNNDQQQQSQSRPYSDYSKGQPEPVVTTATMSDTTHTTAAAAADGSGSKHYAHLGRLAGWLQAQKDAFLGDIKEGKGKGWVVVMGNEAGDLDTIASSVGYAALSSILQAERMVPLMLTPSSMMGLRPENLLALKNAQVPLSTLLHAESLPVPTIDLAGLGVRFALVDHNRLLPQFGAIVPGVVQGVIDHHDDEQEHKDAEVRVIQVPTGSCSSLVTVHFQPAWQASLSGPAGEAGSPVPNEIATLLLSAGLIDTHGFKANGKAMAADYQAAAFTYPLSPWFSTSASSQAVSESFIPPALHDQGKELNVIKHNVSFLSSHDLLLRDYKEYNLPTASVTFPTLRVGLSTVPVGLKDWLAKGQDGWEGLMADIDKYMVERKLDIEGILTTFKSKRGKKKREILLIVRIGGALDNAAAARAIKQIGDGMEADTVLSLIAWEKKGWKRFLNRKTRQHLDGKRRFGRVWEQANAEATRKVVAPLVRDLVAQLK